MLGAAHKQPHTKRKRATTSLDCLEKKAAKTDEKAPWYHCYTKGDVSYNRYMENEWGKPTFDDKKLFESLTLEGAQAGPSPVRGTGPRKLPPLRSAGLTSNNNNSSA